MTDDLFYRFDTLSLHGGQRPDSETGSRAVPVYNSTSFVFDDADHAASLFDVQRPGHLYSRLSNPTVAVFEERMAALEGGVGAVATASGMAALHLVVATLLSAGDHIVASRSLYGGSYNLLEHTLRRFGIDTTFVDGDDPGAFRAAAREETRMFYGETIGNPRMDLLDLAAVSEIAHELGVPLVVDSTFATPYLCRPLEHGADLVVHSATKFLGGHGVTLGGVVVDGGRFDWAASRLENGTARFPTLVEESPGYHGIRFAEQFGPLAFVMKARLEALRDFGACLNPQAAFYLLQGLETLPLRMQRHVANAERVARFLDEHEAVRWVNYPGLDGHPQAELASRLLPRGAGAILTFGVEGGREAGRVLIESLQLFSHLANVGDAKSLVIHPASTTHQQMSDSELDAAGVSADMVRLSIGLEDPEDLLSDLSKALKRCQKSVARKEGR